MKFEKHVFICANDKPEPKKCCRSENGLALVQEFNRIINEKGLKGQIRAQKAGCLDACAHGPALVVYPEGTYYGNVEIKDVEEIVNEHLINNKEIARLKIN